MKQLYLLDDAMISPSGFTTSENLKAVKQGVSGLKPYSFAETKTYAGFISEEKIDAEFQEIGNPKKYTKLEKMLILAIQQVLINWFESRFDRVNFINHKRKYRFA